MPPRVLPLVALGFLALPFSAQATLFDVTGPTADSYGQVCDVVGDTNGDGFGDVLVGAWRAENGALTDAGAVYVYSGADGSLLRTFPGLGANDHMGFGSSGAGDVNGDGFADLCAAADEDDVPGIGPNAGSATVYSGLDGSVLHTFTGTAANDLFGWSTAAVGDVNGDGRDDVLVGAPQDEDVGVPSSAGSLSVFSGLDGSLLFRVYGEASGNQLGSSVGRVGDVNGDGRADFAGTQTNLVRVFSGADGSEIWRRNSGGGSLVVGGGLDANRDGFGDYLIGAPAISNLGRVQLLSGADNSVIHEFLGLAAGDQLGASVAGAGDLDADGVGDFVFGIPGFDGAAGTNTGAVRAISGRTGGVIVTLEGASASARLGAVLGAGRDVNGDGIPDAFAGAVSSGRLKAVSFVPTGLEPFGSGSPGCRGASALLGNGVPTLGNAAFALHAANVGGFPLLLIGDSEDPTGTLHFGARFHLDFAPPPPAVGLLFQLRLPAPDPSGTLVAPFAIPNDATLLGRPFVFQLASLYARGACSTPLATTRGLRLTVQ